MEEQCPICKKEIQEGSLYGQLTLTIERCIDNVVYVEEAKAIVTLCLDCAIEYNDFEASKRLID